MIAVAILVTTFALAVGATNPTPAAASSLCPGDWVSANIGPGFRDYIRAVCYNPQKGGKHGVWLYLTNAGASNCRDDNSWCRIFAQFVTQHPEWQSDRPLESVQFEIKWHSRAAVYDPSKINPTHIQYLCDALEWWEKAAYGCWRY